MRAISSPCYFKGDAWPSLMKLSASIRVGNSDLPMSKSRLNFKQSDVQRAIRAVAATGASMSIEIAPDGTIRLVPAQNSAHTAPPRTKPKTLF